MFLSVIVGLLVGWVNALYAPKRGRDPLTWFVLGILFSLLSLITLLLLPPVKKKSEKKKAFSGPSFSGTTIDVTPLEEGKVSQEIQLDEVDQNFWYYLDQSRQQKGPVRFSELQDLFFEGAITEKTYLWSEGMKEWKLLQNLKGLLSNLSK